MTSATSDRAAVTGVVDAFFAAFVSGPEAVARAEGLREVLHPDAVVVRTCGEEPQVLDVDAFIAPRAELLAAGRLLDFREWATSSEVRVFGDIAQVWVTYEKSWREAATGVHHHSAGAKSLQLARTAGLWRITAVVWDDER